MELIKVNYENGRPTVLARTLHEFLEVATPYDKWFPRMCEYGFIEGEGGCRINGKKPLGRQPFMYSKNKQKTTLYEHAYRVCSKILV